MLVELPSLREEDTPISPPDHRLVREEDEHVVLLNEEEEEEDPLLELATESSAALKDDLELFVEEFSAWDVSSEESKNRLREVRNRFVRAARAVRRNRPDLWSTKHAEVLQQALVVADARITGQLALLRDSIFAPAMEELKAEDQVRMEALQTTFSQHEMDLRMCFRMTAGWVCIWLFCYAPWMIVGTIMLVEQEESPELYSCEEKDRSYVFGFVILLCINGCCNWTLSWFASVDDGKTWITRKADFIAGFLSLTFVGYVVYGLTLIWTPKSLQTSDENCSMNTFVFATVIAFLATPCLCFPLQLWVRNRKEGKRRRLLRSK